MADTPGKPTREPTPPGEGSPWALAGLGMQFFAAILLGVYAGNWLDRRLDIAPLGLLGGVLLCGGGAFYSGYRRLTAPKPPRATDDDSDEGA